MKTRKNSTTFSTTISTTFGTTFSTTIIIYILLIINILLLLCSTIGVPFFLTLFLYTMVEVLHFRLNNYISMNYIKKCSTKCSTFVVNFSTFCSTFVVP